MKTRGYRYLRCIEELVSIAVCVLEKKSVLYDTESTATPFDIALAIDIAHDLTQNIAMHLHAGRKANVPPTPI